MPLNDKCWQCKKCHDVVSHFRWLNAASRNFLRNSFMRWAAALCCCLFLACLFGSQPNGRTMHRLYYTLLPGLQDPNYLANGTWHVIEHKVCVAAHSYDGIEWSERQIVIERRRDVPTEDTGVVGLNAWKTEKGYRCIYTGLGTKFKTYALAEAASADGLTWDRGIDAGNVSLTLQRGAWDGGMIGYPCLLPERDRVRLFYNGAGGDGTGIGMAFASLVE